MKLISLGLGACYAKSQSHCEHILSKILQAH
jgi:hypothetical protein